MKSNILTNSFVASGLTPSVTYRFKVKARNAFDLGYDSDTLTILCGFVPETPASPASQIVADKIVITWVAPYNNGAPIEGYTIRIKDANGVFREEPNSCDGSLLTIVS